MSTTRRVGLVVGVLAFAVLAIMPAPAGLSAAGWRTAALATWMAIWWLTEAVPIPATALLPLVVLPLVNAGSMSQVAAPYANPVIFLFMGGFLIALAMARWNLHRRLALHLVSRVGSRPSRLVGGFMFATAFLSMWVSNTAVTLMMLPIGLSVVRLAGRGESDTAGASNFGLALMLGIAYGASVGGLGTLVGTPPNAFLAGFLEETYGIRVGFAEWMSLGLPLVVLALPLVFFLLTRVIIRVDRSEIAGVTDYLHDELDGMGRISRAERRVGLVFASAALLWISRPLLAGAVPQISDAGIAIGCGLAMFVIPSGEKEGALMDWESAEKLPWGILLLFGGGLSLAAAIDRTELNVWLGERVAELASWPPEVFILVVVVIVVLLTELTSNTATTAAFLPVMAATATQLGWDPRLLVVPAALAASCAFMLPIATPPNAIVYGSGQVTISQMARAGIWLNLLMTVFITIFVLIGLPLAFGVQIP